MLLSDICTFWIEGLTEKIIDLSSKEGGFAVIIEKI